MGIVVRERAAHESALMDHKQGLSEMILCGKIQPEPLIRSGWGKCRDSKVQRRQPWPLFDTFHSLLPHILRGRFD